MLAEASLQSHCANYRMSAQEHAVGNLCHRLDCMETQLTALQRVEERVQGVGPHAAVPAMLVADDDGEREDA